MRRGPLRRRSRRRGPRRRRSSRSARTRSPTWHDLPPVVVSRLMFEEPEHAAWAYRSPCYRALNLTFGIRSTDPDVGAYLGHVLTGLRCHEEDPGTRSGTRSLRSGPEWTPSHLHFGSELVVRAHSREFAVETLLWHLNRATVNRADPFVVLHAGGVTLGGAGAIISGPSGAGKTTLTAALVRAGFRLPHRRGACH